MTLTWAVDSPAQSITEEDGAKLYPTIKDFTEALKNGAQVSQQFSGIYEDEDIFFNELYDLINSGKIRIYRDILNKSIDNEKFKSLEYFYEILTKNSKLSINRVTAFMKGSNLMIDDAFATIYGVWLSEFISSRPQPLKIDTTFRRVITDCVKWSFTYLKEDALKQPSDKTVQVWYKNNVLTESQKWFMNLSMKLGCTIVYIDITKQMPIDSIPMVTLDEVSEPKELPTEKVEIFSTVAHDASQEFNRLMNSPDESGQAQSLFFRPFQFKESSVRSVHLRTTYDELKIIGPSEAYLRTGFRATNREVTIPTLFAKINGVPEDEQSYWNLIDTLKPIKFSNDFQTITTGYASRLYAEVHEMMFEENFTPEKLVEVDGWKFDFLSTGAQLVVAREMIRLVKEPVLENFPNMGDELTSAITLNFLMGMNVDIIKKFHQFDYPKETPKIMWFDKRDGKLGWLGTLGLVFLNRIGFDCFVFSPNAQNSVENYLTKNLVDIFWLENLKGYTLDDKKSSNRKRGFLKRLFEG